MLHRRDIRKVLKILEEKYRHTGTALSFRTPFQLLIATMLSAQSTDNQVNKITGNLFQKFPDVQAFLKLSREELEHRIKSIGLYRSKARNILAACEVLVREYNGEVPPQLADLMRLPGVGRKTANVVLSVGFNHDAIAVDTHVFRVSNRIGLADAPNVIKTEEHLMANIPRVCWSAAHHWLIWHGRQICKAQRPDCSICPLTPYCQYYQRNTTTKS